MAGLTERTVRCDYLQYQTFRQKIINEEALFTMSTVPFQFSRSAFCGSHKCTSEIRTGSLAKPGTVSNITEGCKIFCYC